MKKTAIALSLAVLLTACSPERPAGAEAGAAAQPAGNAGNGRKLIDQYSCISCHMIPGIEGPHGSMGPTLEAFSRRPAIAGRIPNRPDTIAAYLQNPQAVDPQNRMPPLGITEAEARDITAYLFTLK